jgi:hypothetical protein
MMEPFLFIRGTAEVEEGNSGFKLLSGCRYFLSGAKLQTEPVNVVEQKDEEDSESEMSEEETFRSINRIIEYEIEYVTV